MSEEPRKPRRGCLFYGCITCVVLALLLMGAVLLGLHYVKKMVNGFTDTQPMVLPAVPMEPGEIDRVKQRFAAFEAAVREGRPTPPLTLTSEEINALIASGAERQALKGKFHVQIEGEQLKGELSVPLQELGLKMFKGRYLNGSATFSLALHNGVVFLTLQTIAVKGKPLPEVYMQEIRKRNLAAGLVNEPEAAAVVQGLEDIRVREGELVIVPKERK